MCMANCQVKNTHSVTTNHQNTECMYMNRKECGHQMITSVLDCCKAAGPRGGKAVGES